MAIKFIGGLIVLRPLLFYWLRQNGDAQTGQVLVLPLRKGVVLG